jgi:cytochrome c
MKRKLISVLAIVTVIALILGTGCTQLQQIPVTPAPITATASQVHYTSNETLVAFVNSAVAYAKANGKEKALAEFSNPNGSFVRGELYIYAYDFNGTTLAHPVNPEKIGINRLNETTNDVGIILQNMSAVAARGGGFYRFYYINPAHNRIVESKLGYSEEVDDTWWLGSGIYTGPKEPLTPQL